MRKQELAIGKLLLTIEVSIWNSPKEINSDYITRADCSYIIRGKIFELILYMCKSNTRLMGLVFIFFSLSDNL